MIKWLVALLGADALEVRLLRTAIEKDAAYRYQKGAKDGLDLQSLKVLVSIPLVLSGLFVAFAAIPYREDPGLIASFTLTAHLFVFLGLTGLSIIQDLLGSEDFEVVATWPIRSQSFLLAKLAGALKNATIIALFISVPVSFYAMAAVGTPILTGLLLLVITLLFSLALLLVTAALVSWLLGLIGLDNLRLVVVFGSVLLFSCVFLGSRMSGVEIATIDFNGVAVPDLNYEAFAYWWPPAWPASLVAMSATPKIEWLPLALLGLVLLTALPALAFRLAAKAYTPALRQSGQGGGKARGAGFLALLTLGSRRPADRVLAQLCIAHARNDWRFRLQAAMVPLLSFILVTSLFAEPEVANLFSDPFQGNAIFHPAMVMMIAIMLPPLLALPLLSSSSHFQAAWWLQQGVIREVEWRLAVRRLLRLLFVAPFLVLLGIIYLVMGVSLLHIAAHLLMLALLAELMVVMIQSLYSGYPFSRSSQDEELAIKVVLVGLLLEIFGAFIAGAVFHVFYRWWWAYPIGVGLMLAMRRSMLTKGLTENMLLGDATMEQPAATRPSPAAASVDEGALALKIALITAVKAGKTNTARILLGGGADPNAIDDSGRSSLDWAEQLGHDEIAVLLRETAGGAVDTTGLSEQ